jgi:pteridine reductase
MLALITGSGKKRVGAAVATLLAERGFDIAVHYHRSEAEAADTVRELRAFGIQAEAFRADLASEAEVKQLVESVLTRFGRIDMLANCAAIWERKPLEDVTADDVRRHFEVNALGTFLCSQHAGLAMVKQPEGGLIVTVGDWAETRPYTGYAAYFPSKGAVTAMTRNLAVELGTRNPNVRVNCVLPGPVMLPPEMSDAEKKEAIDATLVKREGSPRNVAQAVYSFWENDFITGVCLPVDGGRTVFAP